MFSDRKKTNQINVLRQNDDARTTPCQNWICILPTKFAIVQTCSERQWLLNRAQAKYATTAFKWKNGKLAVVVRAPQTTQNVVRGEDSKEIYKNL